jgi:hypothetical protein
LITPSRPPQRLRGQPRPRSFYRLLDRPRVDHAATGSNQRWLLVRASHLGTACRRCELKRELAAGPDLVHPASVDSRTASIGLEWLARSGEAAPC